jgi:hypothetical protein
LPREEMLARMSSKEITEWMIFYELEPFGSEASYLGHAITSSVVANVNKTKGKPSKPEDFMPKFGRKQRQTDGQMLGLAKALAGSGIGKIVTKED